LPIKNLMSVRREDSGFATTSCHHVPIR
jgi:hypothetical protein